ncbi:MAG: amino acid adenylation domain-containing protein, partial [Actinocatenispora sp.]
EQTSYPLTVAVTVGRELLVRLSYRPDRWDATGARWLVDQLLTALESMAAHPGRPTGRVDVLAGDELRAVRTDQEAAGPGHAAPPLAELVARQVRRTPDAPAITVGAETLSYAELDERAGRLAARLRASGVGPDRIVAVCADRSVELVVALLAVLRAGGAYLPLDPGYPRRRLGYMLADSGAELLLFGTAQAETVEGLGDGRVRLVELTSQPDGDTGPAVDPAPTATPDDLAYVIYTSGSTGAPKGVATTHRAIGNRLLWMQERYGLTGDDVVLQKTPSSFDVSVWEFFWPLISGGRLVLARPDGHRDPAYLAELIARERVSTVHFVPSMLRAFLEQGDTSGCRCLTRVLCSGEELPAPLARQAVDALGVELHNLYGPTEAAVDVTSWRYRPDADTTVVPIGRPIAGTRVHLLDRWLRPVPVGAPGEVYLGGIGLARGYLGRPALTAERFVPDPFGATPGGRLYRTGDLARRRDDGAVVFLGRLDDQVKLRGFRIELGEVEARLAEHPDVRAAAAAVHRDPAGSGRLVGYLVPRAAEPPGSAELREFASRTLPEYMVPNVFVTLPELPLTPSGKLDRAALPEPTRAERPVRREPTGDTERALAGIWRQVLDLPEVGTDDDFFELGGHSLLAMRVIARASRELPAGSAPLSVMDLFSHPTVAELARLAEGGRDGSVGLLHRMTPPRTGVRASLVCVPYGGGSAAVFKPLADALDERHALYAVALPGHDPGVPGEPLRPLPEVVNACADEIDDVAGPLIVYGHCLGGSATAVALAQELERRGREVLGVYIGGSFPSAKLPGRLFRVLARLFPTGRFTGDRSYYNFVRSLGGVTEPLADAEMHLLARALRHDSREAEEYFSGQYTDGGAVPRLRAPIVSVVADRDPTTDMYQERYREWLHFSERVELVVLPGADHFFVRGQAEPLAGIVTAERNPAAPQRAGQPERSTPAERPESVARPEIAARPAPAAQATRPESAARAARAEPLARSAAEPVGEPSRLASLRRFSAITAGELVSQIGSGLTAFAVGLWVYLSTGSLTEFALVEMFATLPGVLLTPLVGAVVDRTSRRRVMAVANTVAGAAQAVLAVLAFAGHLGIGTIYPLLAVVSLAMMFERVAFLSAIPQLAPKRYAFRLNGIVQVAMGLAQVVAPLLAVAVLHAFGVTGVLGVDAVSFAAVTVVLLAVRFPATQPRLRRESLRAEIAHGFSYVLGRRGLRDLLVYFAALSVFTAPVFLLVTPLVLPFSTVGTVGTLLVVAGAGSIVGGLVISLWGGPARVMAGVLGSTVVGGAAIAAVGLRPTVPLIGAALFVYLLSAAVFQGCYATMVQLRVPPLLQGRVFAFVQMVSLGAAPLAYVAAGPLGERVFEPLLARGGPLAGTVGAVIGTGPGRGIALMYVLAGLAIVALTVAARRRPALWNLERALPEEPTPPGPVGPQEGDGHG